MKEGFLPLTLWTQSFIATSPMHLSSALADRTKMKLRARCTLVISFSSNLPASSFSTSMKTLKPRNCRCTFSRLQRKKRTGDIGFISTNNWPIFKFYTTCVNKWKIKQPKTMISNNFTREFRNHYIIMKNSTTIFHTTVLNKYIPFNIRNRTLKITLNSVIKIKQF